MNEKHFFQFKKRTDMFRQRALFWNFNSGFRLMKFKAIRIRPKQVRYNDTKTGAC